MSGYRYTGAGTHFTVPAKDFTKDEFDNLAPMDKRIVRNSPAWEAATAAEAKKIEAEAKKAEQEAVKAGAEAKKAADDTKGGS